MSMGGIIYEYLFNHVKYINKNFKERVLLDENKVKIIHIMNELTHNKNICT